MATAAAGVGDVVVAKPKVNSIAIELTAHCNQKCSYCYNEWREDGGAALGATPQKAIHARVDKLLANLDIDHVTLTGGEPFLHKEIFTIIEKFSAHGVDVQIISNGGIIDDRLAARLAPFKVRYVQCTLNAPDALLHNQVVGGDGHFEKTLLGIDALKRHGVPVVGCVVVTKKNAHLVGKILQIFLDRGIKYIALSRFSPAGYATRAAAELLPTTGELTVAFEQAEPFGRDHGMHITCTMPIPPCSLEVERFKHVGFGTCPIGTSMQELALGPDGKLRNCTLHREAIGGVDDILAPDVNLAELLRAAEITEYRRKAPAFCEGCLHEKTCGGGCGAAAEWTLGRDPANQDRRQVDPFVFQHVDDDFAQRLERERAGNGKRQLEVIL